MFISYNADRWIFIDGQELFRNRNWKRDPKFTKLNQTDGPIAVQLFVHAKGIHGIYD